MESGQSQESTVVETGQEDVSEIASNGLTKEESSPAPIGIASVEDATANTSSEASELEDKQNNTHTAITPENEVQPSDSTSPSGTLSSTASDEHTLNTAQISSNGTEFNIPAHVHAEESTGAHANSNSSAHVHNEHATEAQHDELRHSVAVAEFNNQHTETTTHTEPQQVENEVHQQDSSSSEHVHQPQQQQEQVHEDTQQVPTTKEERPQDSSDAPSLQQQQLEQSEQQENTEDAVSEQHQHEATKLQQPVTEQHEQRLAQEQQQQEEIQKEQEQPEYSDSPASSPSSPSSPTSQGELLNQPLSDSPSAQAQQGSDTPRSTQSILSEGHDLKISASSDSVSSLDSNTSTNTTSSITSSHQHSSHHKKHAKSQAEEPVLFDHFVVVGLPPSLTLPNDERIKAGGVYPPQVLYQYPEDIPLSNGKVSSFCMPSGVVATELKRTPSGSELNKILLGASYLSDSSNSFIFRLTGENYLVYGICITKLELLEEGPSFINFGGNDFSDEEDNYNAESNNNNDANGNAESIVTNSTEHDSTSNNNNNSNPNSPLGGAFRLKRRRSYIVAPRCYCFLSKFPFFSLHFEVLLSLLGQDRVSRFTQATQQQQPEDSGVFAILKSYYSQQVPKSGQTLYFHLPGELKSKTLYCPLGDWEGRLVADWNLVTALKALSTDHLLLMYTAALLEKPIIIVSQNLSTLSSIVLSFIPLLRPFKWQGLLIPVLPHFLSDVLQAPVPYITGVERLSTRVSDCIIFDLDHNRTFNDDPLITRLPEGKKLRYNLAVAHAALCPHHPSKTVHHHNPHVTTNEQKRLAAELLEQLHTYTKWMLEKITSHYLKSNLPLDSSKNRDALAESFVNTVSPQNREFISSLLQTQMFSVFTQNNFT